MSNYARKIESDLENVVIANRYKDALSVLTPEQQNRVRAYVDRASSLSRSQDRYHEHESSTQEEESLPWGEFLENWNFQIYGKLITGAGFQIRLAACEAQLKEVNKMTLPKDTPLEKPENPSLLHAGIAQDMTVSDRRREFQTLRKFLNKDIKESRDDYDRTRPIGSSKSRVPLWTIAQISPAEEGTLSPTGYDALDKIFANVNQYGTEAEKRALVTLVESFPAFLLLTLPEDERDQIETIPITLSTYMQTKWNALQDGNDKALQKVSPTNNKVLALSLVKLFFTQYTYHPEVFLDIVHVLFPDDATLASSLSELYAKRFAFAEENGFLKGEPASLPTFRTTRRDRSVTPVVFLPTTPSRAERMKDYQPGGIPEQNGKVKQPTPTVASKGISIFFEESFDLSTFGSAYQAELIARLEKLSYEKAEDIATDPSGLFETAVFGSNLKFEVENNEIKAIIVTGAWAKKTISQLPFQS